MTITHDGAKITHEMLHAFADGQLNDKDMLRVEKYLASNSEHAEEVEEWKAQNQLLNQMFSPDEAAERTKNIDLPSLAPNSPWITWGTRIAAVMMLTVASAALGWGAHGTFLPRDTILEVATLSDARQAHLLFASEVLHPVDVSGDQKTHLVEWLSKRLDTPLLAPDLSASNFDLLGGRLLPAGDRAAAQFMYEDPTGQRLTLYVSPGHENQLASFQFDNTDNLSSVYWQDETLQYAIVGSMSHDELSAIATRVYRQLI